MATPPSRRRPAPLLQVLMLVVVLAVVGVGLAVLGGVVLLPQGSALIFILLAGVLFLGGQVLVFRWLGLRSAADEASAEDTPGDPDDWKAWRD